MSNYKDKMKELRALGFKGANLAGDKVDAELAKFKAAPVIEAGIVEPVVETPVVDEVVADVPVEKVTVEKVIKSTTTYENNDATAAFLLRKKAVDVDFRENVVKFTLDGKKFIRSYGKKKDI